MQDLGGAEILALKVIGAALALVPGLAAVAWIEADAIRAWLRRSGRR